MTERARRGGTGAALIRACHPEPTATVTVLTTALAALAGASLGKTLIVCGAVLTGQLSIGWSNDLLDARRDESATRLDKPVATGAVSSRTVAAAAALAVGLTVPLSAAAGPQAGPLHLLAVVGGGWAYNLGLKRVVLSFVPYAVAFGALPVFAVVAAGGQPRWWLATAGALLGVGAHLFNVLPDIDDDRATGVRGLPVVLGPRATRIGGCLLLLGAAAVLVFGPAQRPGLLGWLLFLAAAALAAAAAVVDRTVRSKRPFQLALAVAAVDIALLAGRAAELG